MAIANLRTEECSGKYLSLQISQAAASGDPTKGTSVVYWQLYSSRGTGEEYYVGPTTVTVNGKQVYYEYKTRNEFPGTDGYESGQLTVQHNTDGTLIIPFSLVTRIAPGNSTVEGDVVEASLHGTLELDPITMKPSILAADNFTDEDDPSITYDNPIADRMTTLQAYITSADGAVTYVAKRDLPKYDYSYIFELTNAERNALRNASPNSRTLPVRFYITATSDDGQTFTEYLDKTCTIINSHPSISVTVTDINPTTLALTGNNQTLVRYHSNAEYTITGTAYKGASISKYSAEHGAVTINTATGVFEAIESSTFKFSVIDSRSNLTSATREITTVPYVNPTCNFDYDNPTTDGDLTFTLSGNYFSGSFGAVNNTLSLQYRYKTATATEYGDWITLTPTMSDSMYTVSVNLTNLDYQTDYMFQARIADKLHEDYVYSKVTNISTKPMFHWSKDDFVFEVPVTFNAGMTNSGEDANSGTIEGDCNITGNLRLKGSGNYGNALYFGEKEYCYLKENTDDDLTIHASDIILDSDKVLIDDVSSVTVNSTNVDVNATTLKVNGQSLIVGGTWTPKLNNDICITSYTTQTGWYSRIGNVVIIGFMVAADYTSGYSSTSISMTGVPFVPAFEVRTNLEFYKESGTSTSTTTQYFTLSDNGTITVSTKYGSSAGYVSFAGTLTYITV